MFLVAPTLHPVRQRRFRQYASFLQSIGVKDDRFAVTPADEYSDAEVGIRYHQELYKDADLKADTRVVFDDETLVFESDLDQALFHLSWYFDAERGPAAVRAVNASNLVATMMLDLGDDDVAIDGDGRRTGHIIRRQKGSAELILIETYGQEVPIASSLSAVVLAYLVRCLNDLETSDIVERTAKFLPND